MKEYELVWAFLPEGLEEYFDLESFEKDERRFRIILVEKNVRIPGNCFFPAEACLNCIVAETLYEIYFSFSANAL